MSTLDKLPRHSSNDGYLHRVCIPCVYNSGRIATVRATIDRPDIIHISIETDNRRPYQGAIDGYLHIETDTLERWLSHNPNESIMSYCHQEALNCIEMIKGINRCFFAGTLTVLSDDKAIVNRRVPRMRTIRQICRDVWQAYLLYDGDMSWLLLESGKETLMQKLIGRIRTAARKLR